MNEKKSSRWGAPEEVISAFRAIDAGEGRPVEPWHQEDDFDPPFLRGQLRYYEKRGWIEIDETYQERGQLRFRFTAAGRDKFEELEGEEP